MERKGPRVFSTVAQFDYSLASGHIVREWLGVQLPPEQLHSSELT